MFHRKKHLLFLVPLLGLVFSAGCGENAESSSGTTYTAPQGHDGEAHGKVNNPAEGKAKNPAAKRAAGPLQRG